MKKQTAVTQLIEQLTAVGALEIPEGTNAITMIIADAKEMQWEQITNAYLQGCEKGEMFNNENRAFSIDAEQYYTETFNP